MGSQKGTAQCQKTRLVRNCNDSTEAAWVVGIVRGLFQGTTVRVRQHGRIVVVFGELSSNAQAELERNGFHVTEVQE